MEKVQHYNKIIMVVSHKKKTHQKIVNVHIRHMKKEN
jgi:hypothetical protein